MFYHVKGVIFMMWQSWVNLAAGIWLILSGIIPSIHTPASMIVAGAVAVICGFWAGVEKWPGYVTGIIGIWLLLSAIWFGLVVSWNFILFGIIVALIAIWNLSSPPHGRPVEHPI